MREPRTYRAIKKFAARANRLNWRSLPRLQTKTGEVVVSLPDRAFEPEECVLERLALEATRVKMGTGSAAIAARSLLALAARRKAAKGRSQNPSQSAEGGRATTSPHP